MINWFIYFDINTSIRADKQQCQRQCKQNGKCWFVVFDNDLDFRIWNDEVLLVLVKGQISFQNLVLAGVLIQ